MIALRTFSVKASSDNSLPPGGKPIVLVFTNVNYSFNKAGNSEAFQLTRAYLGYEYFFDKSFSSKAIIDVADPGAGKLQMTAFIKNAYLQYKNDNFSARLGMIGTDQYTIPEKQWGYRYIYKSFQDAYDFGPSADLGAAFEFSPLKVISIDFSVLNGEGYKRVQLDSTFKTAFGLTLKPFKGFVLRSYFDLIKKAEAQISTSLYAGYSYKKFKAGVEYNFQKNNALIKGHDFSGMSVYASLVLTEKLSMFARYDRLTSVVTGDIAEPWNLNKDGQLYITGFDYSPVKGVKFATTFLGWSPYDKSKYFTSTFALYIEIKI